MNLRICSSRSTTTASVGVCTRPTVVRKKPPSRELKAVIARVPLMPTSQSASERDRAASARPCICLLLRSASKPSRIACGVIDCSQSRRTGLPSGVLPPPAYCSISRKISSPSRPASHALTRSVDVLALGLLDHRVQARLGLVHRLEVEVGRNHRQVREAPLAALDVELLGRLDLHQVAHGAGDDVFVVLEMLVVLVELAGHGRQRADDVLRHGRFLGNYQRFHLHTVSASTCILGFRRLGGCASVRRA